VHVLSLRSMAPWRDAVSTLHMLIAPEEPERVVNLGISVAGMALIDDNDADPPPTHASVTAVRRTQAVQCLGAVLMEIKKMGIPDELFKSARTVALNALSEGMIDVVSNALQSCSGRPNMDAVAVQFQCDMQESSTRTEEPSTANLENFEDLMTIAYACVGKSNVPEPFVVHWACRYVMSLTAAAAFGREAMLLAASKNEGAKKVPLPKEKEKYKTSRTAVPLAIAKMRPSCASWESNGDGASEGLSWLTSLVKVGCWSVGHASASATTASCAGCQCRRCGSMPRLGRPWEVTLGMH